MAKVELQDLALDSNRSNQYPDLIGRQCFGVGAGELLEVGSHGRVLVRGRLDTKIHVFPSVQQLNVVTQLVDVGDGVGEQQAEARHVAYVRTWVQTLNSGRQVCAFHRMGLLIRSGNAPARRASRSALIDSGLSSDFALADNTRQCRLQAV